ncbi:glycoside hydrolase family 3 N-terminal domain-containing protein [Rathayibacter soli]|uniref:glycoside hydrolase family 3 N-terminal domain-containing protein n=1 Tax=Rathayibacter soli TaxID=3144168 RepID=UPI0027E49F1D|nr:glycoside hydrolase family 3 N-terminal domain-containing protein [Glaciibacter superstes]
MRTPRTGTAPALRLAASVVLLGLLAGCGGVAKSTEHSAVSPTPTASPTVTPAPRDPIAEAAEERLANMTLPQKVASLLMLHAPGTDAAALRAFVDQYGLGGLILMGDNIPSSPGALLAQTQAISADPALPVLLGIDEEGGDVTRLPWDTAPGADALKSLAVPATTDAFSQRAAFLQQAGVSVNFGIVADVTADTNSFIYDRVLGTNPADASARVAAAVTAERGKVLSTLKHFPGHGETEADSHRTIPTTALSLANWSVRDAPSFAAGIAAGAPIVMFGHLVYSAVDAQPASLSVRWHEILRQQLGFDGITITDDLRMLQDTGLPQYQNPSENAIAALAAGNTMLLFVTGASVAQDGIDPARVIADIVAAVQSGRISLRQLDEDARMLLLARLTLGSAQH